MKKNLMLLRDCTGGLKKLWILSKRTLLFVLLGILNAQAAAYSQSEQQVTLSMKNAYLKDVIWAIKEQANFVFMYNQEDLDKAGKVNVDVKDAKIENILNACLQGTGLTYVVDNNVIVLKPTKDEKKVKEIIVSGVVTDTKKVPLPGVTVMVKGLSLGTATDPDGKYTLRIPAVEGAEVVFIYSFIGMLNQEIKYQGQETINVVMKEEAQKMDEVIVTGYLNVRKESFTGNVTKVSQAELLKANNKNVLAALQVFDPSFRLKANNVWGSDPNSLPEFNLRGESSIEVNKGLDYERAKREQRTNLKDNPNLPIFILDGFQVGMEQIYDMDVHRIQDITILKDAAATAVYGAQAANGVVVVTTIPPKPGELQISYRMTGGVDLPDLSDYNLCNAAEMLEVERLSGLYDFNDSYQAISYNNILNDILRGVDTDWLAQPLRNVFNHSHSIGLTGGAEAIRYGLNFNYDSNEGVMKDSKRTRIGVSLNLDYRPKEWLQINNQISYSKNNTENTPYGSFSTYTSLKPYYAKYDAEGNLAEFLVTSNENPIIRNPMYNVENFNSYDGRGSSDNLTNNMSVNMFIGKGFQVRGSFSIGKSTSESHTFQDPRLSGSSTPADERGSLSIQSSNSWNWTGNANLYYNTTFANNHFINAMVGVNVNASSSESTSTKLTGFGLSDSFSPIYAAKQPDKSNITNSKDRRIGFIGSVNYSIQDIYLFDASFRFDASSKFAKDKQWAPFWSVGYGMNFHNYEFLKDHWLISNLRVRGSYGSTGNVSFPNSMAVTTYKIHSDDWFFTGPATSLVGLGNPGLTWEKTKTFDVGIDVGFLQGLINLNASYYHKKTEDLVDKLNIRASSGFNSYSVNSGSILNEGIELSLSATVLRTQDWTVSVNANLGHNKNTIKELGQEAKAYNETILKEWEALASGQGSSYSDVLSRPVIMYFEGASKSAMYAVRSEGIDPANGKERFIKKNGMSTYTWDPNDQVVVGDSNPDASGSISLNVGYKGLYVNASFMYSWGAQTYNETLLNKVENVDIRSNNVDKRVLTQRWKNPGDRAPFYDLENNTKTQVTTRFVQDDNYFTFNSLSMGYDFNRNLISKLKLRSLNLSFNMNDIFRWSTVKEERGLSYPYSKKYNFTLSIGI